MTVIHTLIQAIEGEKLPALLLDDLVFEENCRSIAEKVNGKTIRIATKSMRSVELLKQIENSHQAYHGLCAIQRVRQYF
ncbi:hypothetical protein IEO70_08875 [Bacillus sp. AGMB 02131]|uniref:Uncharacterized protein n=1 Tax=Peribacillus faecalis TaxID=2772559 RepID=A0A927CZZ0_9BACI|nr:hypothetical protein [Peribacillus faecalis]MBD3108479.1 hypothetical protein [Peribacillus faecalis]